MHARMVSISFCPNVLQMLYRADDIGIDMAPSDFTLGHRKGNA